MNGDGPSGPHYRNRAERRAAGIYRGFFRKGRQPK